MTQTSLVLGADHRGFALKQALLPWAQAQGWQVEDVGAHELQADDDYPDIAEAVAKRVQSQPGVLGVVVCGSGIGVAIAANKIPGIRAGQGITSQQVREAREHLDLNILTLSGDQLTPENAQSMIYDFMTTPASTDERHVRRRSKILALESNQ